MQLLYPDRGEWGGCYTRCRERGMPHGKALKALARKRLKVIYAVMRDRAPYAAQPKRIEQIGAHRPNGLASACRDSVARTAFPS